MDGSVAGWGLQGRVALVTGAAQGIGAATTRAFADVGARVCAVDIQEAPLGRLVSGLPGDGHAAVVADLNDLGGHDDLVARADALVVSRRWCWRPR